ncbi:MAG: hypothetical protein Q9191_002325 [Dirinaria sp. TL-2023a]
MPKMFVGGILMLALLAATTVAQAPPHVQVRASPSNATGCGNIIPPSGLPTSFPGSLQPQDVETENQIRNTLGHYPLAIDGKNFDALNLVFTEDAVANYSAPLNVLVGLSQIQLVLQKSLAPVLSQHAFSSQVIEIEEGGETAKTVTYFTASQFGTGNKTGKVGQTAKSSTSLD